MIVKILITISNIWYQRCCFVANANLFCRKIFTSLCITHIRLSTTVWGYEIWIEKYFIRWEFYSLKFEVIFLKSSLKRESLDKYLREIELPQRYFASRNNREWKMISQLIHNLYKIVIFSRKYAFDKWRLLVLNILNCCLSFLQEVKWYLQRLRKFLTLIVLSCWRLFNFESFASMETTNFVEVNDVKWQFLILMKIRGKFCFLLSEWKLKLSSLFSQKPFSSRLTSGCVNTGRLNAWNFL